MGSGLSTRSRNAPMVYRTGLPMVTGQQHFCWFANESISEGEAALLAKDLRSPHGLVTKIKMSKCSVSIIAAAILLKGVAQSERLAELQIVSCRAPEAFGGFLVKALQDNQSLTALHLANNSFGKRFPAALSVLLESELALSHLQLTKYSTPAPRLPDRTPD
jgi:hypothetical protein